MKIFIRDILVSILIAIVLLTIVLFFFLHRNSTQITTISNISSKTADIPTTTPTKKGVDSARVILSVPYISEAPDGNWTGPWKNACEEASITMVDKFYLGEKVVSARTAKEFMQMLFDTEDKIYKSNANSDAARTAYLINNYSSFKGKIKEKPTIGDIKAELKAGRPVISFHRGFDLKNKNIPFLATGSSFHAMVIIGYDDDKRVFITNDDGDVLDGAGHEYSYNLFMNSLHDYNYTTNNSDGIPRAIFTSK